MDTRGLSRRKFLRLVGLAGAGTILGACAPRVIKETVEVEKVVTQVVQEVVKETVVVEGEPKEVTKVVEKVVTATPLPNIVTAHGRVLPDDAAPLDKQVFYEAIAEPAHLDVGRDIYRANIVLNWGTEPLLRRNENQEIVPALAESYEAGPGAAYFDFKIRTGAKWSDGTPITADDFVFTYRHISNPNLDTPWVWFYYDIKGVKRHKLGEIPAEEVGVEKIDDQTVRIHAEADAAPHIPALVAYQAATPVPKHLAEDNPEHWADTVEGWVSCGPFKLIKWEHNQRTEWEPNEYYNGPHKPGIQKVVGLMGLPGFNSWLNCEIDLYSLSVADLQRVRADPKLNPLIHFYNNFQTDYLALDTMNPPLDNLKLRQALSHAIDRETMCYQVLAGTYLPGYSMLPPDFPAYNPELKEVQKFDVELAKQLLAEAGYPDGKDASGKQLEIEMFGNGRDVALEFTKEQWETHLGIKVNLTPLEGAVWSQRRAEHSMMVYKGPYEYDYLDPANLLTSLWKSVDEKGSPRHAWRNEEFDDLVTKAGSMVDHEERMATYQKAERILVEDVGGIFLKHMVMFHVWWPYLVGMHPDKNGNVVFRGLDISRFQMYINNTVDEYRKPH
ncbi:MAG: peptide ABC transporter substrate-binding protein [Chloroflexi bacterium]|nr:peptide ABC transporter substrate-binding protein [Chloroflexota bacterium]